MAKCPYCEKPVVIAAGVGEKSNEVRRESFGIFKKEVMYSCPHCDRILGFGHFIGGLMTGRP